MMVKNLQSIFILALVLGLLAACGGAAAPAPEQPAAQAPAATEEPAAEAPAAATEEAMAEEAPAATEEAMAEEAPAEPGTLQVWMTWGDNPAQVHRRCGS
jgi:anaerobic selenocysteine-containing dehydrogenase